MKKRRKSTYSGIKVRGFARVQIGEYDEDGNFKGIVGDSGWFKNTLTTDDGGGLTAYIAAKVGDVTGSKTPSHLQLATQSSAVDATQTALEGETRARKTLTPSTVATGTLRMTAEWGSTDNTAVGSPNTIGSIAVYNTSAAGTMAAAQSFTTSQWASNQAVSATWNDKFMRTMRATACVNPLKVGEPCEDTVIIRALAFRQWESRTKPSCLREGVESRRAALTIRCEMKGCSVPWGSEPKGYTMNGALAETA